MSEELDAAVDRAISRLTLGISDALGPTRPVAGVQSGERRRSKLLLRAMREAYAELVEVDAQHAYDNMAEHLPVTPEPPVVDPLDLLPVAEPPSESVRAIPAGLPTLGKGHR